MVFKLKKFLADVFDPQPEESILVMVDVPHDDINDSDLWLNRRKMAEEWRQEFVTLSKERGFSVLPLLTYLATGSNGANLPEEGVLDGKTVKLANLFPDITLVVALTEFSATAPLAGFAEFLPRFRGASMPGVSYSMQKTGFAADYKVIQKRCEELRRYMENAVGIEVEFSTGHSCYFDLRYRKPSVDDGKIDTSVWGKKGDAILNLPGGETFEVPYEGEKIGDISKTRGQLPIEIDGEKAVFIVENNKIVEVEGAGRSAREWRDFIRIDGGRRNIAEVAFGCNELADPDGPKIESEKAGFHWALGVSDHLGGVIGEGDFDNSENACHEDMVYAGKNHIVVKQATIRKKEGEIVVMKDGKYLV